MISQSALNMCDHDVSCLAGDIFPSNAVGQNSEHLNINVYT